MGEASRRLIGNISYGRGSADRPQVGTVAGLALNAEFANYEDLSVEGGLRLHVAAARASDPYVNIVAGSAASRPSRPRSACRRPG